MATIAAAPPAPVQNRLVRFIKSPTFARILFPFVVLGLWYLIYYTIDSRIFPSPQQVAVFMWEEITLTSGVRYSSVAENLYVQFGITLLRLTIGFFIALILGTIIGLAMGVSKKVDAFFHDWVMGILAMPALVYALFLGIALGFTNLGPILAVVIAGTPFVIINIREGVRNTPRELIDMARSFDVPQNKITRHVLLPSLMPFFFAAIRYAYAVGWKGLVITEVFGTTPTAPMGSSATPSSSSSSPWPWRSWSSTRWLTGPSSGGPRSMRCRWRRVTSARSALRVPFSSRTRR
jgi:NitT/TauT family transport system permease protein